MFLIPDTAATIWPWKLTPLTARVVAGWFALPGVLGLMYASDTRWGSWRIVLQSQVLGVALILLAAARAWDDFDTSRPMTWVFTAGLAGLLVGLIALHLAMDARRKVAARTGALA